jgi:hypothetical protein
VRAQTEQTGLYPVIIDSEFESFGLDEGDPKGVQLERATPDLVTAWASQLRASLAEDGLDDPPRGPFPEDMEPSDTFACLYDLHGDELNEVLIGHVPASSAWEAVIELGFGGFNECPPPETQAAYLRHWNERYGAELFGLGTDTLECMVERPPIDRDAAIALAEEQYWYCTDIVEQGTETLDALAAALMNGGAWFFWWD